MGNIYQCKKKCTWTLKTGGFKEYTNSILFSKNWKLFLKKW